MTPKPAIDETKDFADALLRWFDAAMRPLPWRRDYAPYNVWISEIMLQQTQMERGVRHYENWMRRFPDIASVARSDQEAILAAWEGLGYYSRARNLHAAAKHIMRDHNGQFPDTTDAIRALPGIGEYTAGAIASIAFNLPVPAVDANVLRIFSRLRNIDAPVVDKKVKTAVDAIVRSLLAVSPPRLLNQALMEFGALVCGKIPKCPACPLAARCEAQRLGTVADRPVKTAKTGYTLHETAAGIVMRAGRAFIRKRPANGLWAGLWEFPGGAVAAEETPEQAALRHILEATGLRATVREALGAVRHGYTTNRVTMHGFLCEATESPDEKDAPDTLWIAPEEIADYAFAAGHRKLLERLGWKHS